jgi:hypothetical protein
LRITYDVFPARLIVSAPNVYKSVHYFKLPEEKEPKSIPEGTFYVEVSRIVLTEDEVLVAVENEDGAQIIFRDKYDPLKLEKSTFLNPHNRLTTETGRMLIFEKDSTCGCGARLKSWNPYRTLGASLGANRNE